jgi:hypothetical protein
MRYSTATRKMTSMVLFKCGKNDGITVYVPMETILKEMAAKIKLSQHFFLDLVQELSPIGPCIKTPMTNSTKQRTS